MALKWNRHNENWLISASRDHFCKLFDIRHLKEEVQCFRGHKKEACSKQLVFFLCLWLNLDVDHVNKDGTLLGSSFMCVVFFYENEIKQFSIYFIPRNKYR